MPGLIPDATGQPGGTGMENPFGMANSLMDFQNKANQNRKFQAEFMANQALGEIMAHAPSMEEGLNQAQKDPMIMGFGGEGLLNARNTAMVQAQTRQIGMNIAAAKTKLGQDSFLNVATAGLQGADDPQNWNKYFDTAMKGVDPAAMDFVKPRVDALKEGIAAKIQGLNMNDPAQRAQAQKAIQTLVAGGFIGANGDMSKLSAVLPTTSVDQQGVPYQVPSAVGRIRGETETPIPGQVPQPQAPPEATTFTNSATGASAPVDVSGVTPYLVRDRQGNPVTTVQGRNLIDQAKFGDMDKNLKEQHSGPELTAYNGDRSMLNSLGQMQAASDDLTARGGFTVPGLFGTARGAISNALETFENITGTKLTGDAALPAKDADAQVINKWAHALPFALKNNLDGTNGRGLGVLMEAAAAVPSLENTPLGFKVLTAGLKALANWDIGKYEFKEKYLAHPGNSSGSLLGSDVAYNKVSTPLGEAMKELSKEGIVLDGTHIKFTDDTKLTQAYQRGLFGKQKDNPDDPDGPAEKAMDDMYDVMHPDLKPKK
jgi:hypothetical protein